jgi:citrate synthase
MIEDPATRIGRPRQVYVGPTERWLPRALPEPRH